MEFKSHREATCPTCNGPLRGHRASGKPHGEGAHQAICVTCQTSHLYDLPAELAPTEYPQEVLYTGLRTAEGTTVLVGGKPLDPRLDLQDHSPTGFEWGYGGSGPAQLALAILAHHLQDNALALQLYQDFKMAVILPLVGDAWGMTSLEVEQRVRELLAKIPVEGPGQ